MTPPPLISKPPLLDAFVVEPGIWIGPPLISPFGVAIPRAPFGVGAILEPKSLGEWPISL